MYIFIEAEYQGASTITFESSTTCFLSKIFFQEVENIWILITTALYNEENKKEDKENEKRIGKKPLNLKRVIHESSFNCLMFSMKYFGDGKNTFPITINAITSGIS